MRAIEWHTLPGKQKANHELRKPEEKNEAICIGRHQACREFAAKRTCNILGNQLLRAGTSVGANYRAACRAKSTADFISKMGTVEEEADESGYWTELLVDAGKLKLADASPLIKEAGELTAIAVSSIKTAQKSGGR